MSFGAIELKTGAQTYGLSRAPRNHVGHTILADGVRLHLPADRPLTDAEARRLAWGLLADLAPEETVPVPDVVTYKEAQRLAVLRCLLAGAKRIDEVAEAIGWKRRTAERRLYELVEDGRVRKERVDSRTTLFHVQRGVA